MTLDSVRTSGYNSWFSYQVTLTYYLTNKQGVEEFCLLKAYNLNDSKSYWTLYSDKNSEAGSVRGSIVSRDRQCVPWGADFD